MNKLADHISFTGRILFLTEDTSLIRAQLEAEGDRRETLEAELAQLAHRQEVLP